MSYFAAYCYVVFGRARRQGAKSSDTRAYLDPVWAGKYKSSELAFAAPAGTLPEYFAKLVFDYCKAVAVAGQGAVIAAVAERTTASSNEQKYRTPVWFGVSGEAMML
jgi:hypothetical protein